MELFIDRVLINCTALRILVLLLFYYLQVQIRTQIVSLHA